MEWFRLISVIICKPQQVLSDADNI